MIAEKIRTKVKAISDEEFDLYIGPKAEKFSAVRKSVLVGKDYFSWKLGFAGIFLGLLVPSLWMAYHRRWLYAWLFLIFCVAMIFVPNGPIIASVLGAFFGSLLPTLYISDVAQNISKIKSRNSDSTTQNQILLEHGLESNKNPYQVFLFFCLAVILSLGAAAFSISRDEGLSFEDMFVSSVLPECASRKSLHNVQTAAPKVIDLIKPLELPFNWQELEEAQPQYRADKKLCSAIALTSEGKFTIFYTTSIEEGVKGKQIYTVVEQDDGSLRELAMELEDPIKWAETKKIKARKRKEEELARAHDLYKNIVSAKTTNNYRGPVWHDTDAMIIEFITFVYDSDFFKLSYVSRAEELAIDKCYTLGEKITSLREENTVTEDQGKSLLNDLQKDFEPDTLESCFQKIGDYINDENFMAEMLNQE